MGIEQYSVRPPNDNNFSHIVGNVIFLVVLPNCHPCKGPLDQPPCMENSRDWLGDGELLSLRVALVK